MASILSEEEEYAIRKDIQRAMDTGDGSGELNARKKLMDFDSGASYNARALIGSAATIEDKVATAKKFYPDAKKYGDNNIVFTNPETNRKTLANPEGLDFGDLFGANRELMQVAGGFIGGAAGTVTGPWGTAIGGALGSQAAGQASDALNRLLGTVETRSLPRQAAEGAAETLAETFLGKSAEGLPIFLRRAKELVGLGGIRSRIVGQGVAETLEDLQAAGIPTTGAAGVGGSGSTAIRNIDKALRILPGASGVMDRASAQTLEGATGAHRELASQFGTAMTPEGVGTTIKKGMEDAAGRFKERRAGLDAKVGRLLPDGGPILPVTQQSTPEVPAPSIPSAMTQSVVPQQFTVGPPMVINNVEVPGGKIFKAFDEDSGSIDGQFTVIDADNLITSNLPAFPKELQPRDRSRAASDFVVNKIAKKLNPARLDEDPMVSQGAPIIGPDGIVESGNGRVMAIRKAYKAGDADQYKAHLIERSGALGLPPDVIASMSKPVLVRVRTTQLDGEARKAFTQKANQSSIASFSPAENAAKDAEHLPPMTGLDIESPQDLLLIRNSHFVQGFFKKALPNNELGSIVDSEGRLSSAGFSRLKAAIYNKAYGIGDGSVVARLSESLDDNIKNVTSGMLTAAPKMANMGQKIARGDLHPLGISSEISEAAEKLSMLRARGSTVADDAKQGQLFGEEKDPIVEELLGVFERFGGGHKKISEFLSRYADAVDLIGSPKQGSLFGDSPSLSRLEIIQSVNKQMEREYGQQTVVPIVKKTADDLAESAVKKPKKRVAIVDDAAKAKKAEEKLAQSKLAEERMAKVREAFPALSKLLDDTKARYETAPNTLTHLKTAIGGMQDILNDVAIGKMDVTTLRNIRTVQGLKTKFGQLYTGPLEKPGTDIYHAIKQDLLDIVTDISPEAGAALRNHDKYTAAYKKTREPIIEEIIKKETGEQVWTYARGMSQDGGSRLRWIRKNLLPAEWDIVVASTLHRMGLGLPGSQNVAGDMFRHSTFFSNWSKLSKEAKNALFSGTRYNEMIEPLNRLVRVSASLKELDTAINSSNTATATTWIQLLQSPKDIFKVIAASAGAGAAFVAPVALTVASVVMGVGGPYLAAKLWTNPGFVRWLGSGNRIPLHQTHQAFDNFMYSNAGRLLEISGDDEEKQAFKMIHRILTGKQNDR